MDAISLFSGAGGFEIGFERAGIQTVLQAESDPWCRQVLERHWPDVERVTDVRHVTQQTVCEVDLVYGGWPCQGNSVAGRRAGLSDERSGLWAEVRRVLSELRPTYFVGENVPGLLSVNRGRDWAEILMDLEHLGYGWAYRVLDARWFGVPQRRRRVFLVGCLGDEARAAAVLAVCESCGGHPAPRQESEKGLAASLTSSSHGAGSNMPGRHKEDDVNVVVAGTLGSVHHGIEAQQAWTNRLVVARGLTARQERLAGDSDNFVVANGLRASDGHHGHSSPLGDGADNLIALETMGVRRLTPLECERLMGWPDEWTRWTADGRKIPDSHRYRLCGNGVVSTVAEYIGHRLMAVDALLQEGVAK